LAKSGKKTIISTVLTIAIISILVTAIVEINQKASAQTNATNSATHTNALETSLKQGTSLYSLGRYNEAIQYFDRALQINPNDSRALDGKGGVLYTLARYNEAIQYFDRALQINPNDINASAIKNLAVSQLGGVGTNTTQQVQQTQLQQPPPVQQTPVQQPPPVQQTPVQQPVIPPHAEDVDSFKLTGKINSDIVAGPTNRWHATGDVTMIVKDNEVQLFKTNMAWNNGTSGHTHEFQNFKADDDVVLPPDNIVRIEGDMDAGTNNVINWMGVPTILDIGGGGRTITISLDHEETDHHFAGQPIVGVIASLTPCSDEPGPSMQVSPSCS
jgi:hypothetical protein